MRYPSVVAIVLCWNSGADTIECLRTLMQLDYPDCSLLVVDNGSEDGSAAEIRRRYPSVTALTLDENLGYAGGNNAGIRRALERGCDYVWLLNDDTTAAPDSLSRLMDVAMRQPGAGFLGPMVYMREDPRRILSAGGVLQDGWRPRFRGVGVLDVGQFDAPSEVDLLSGAALLVKREAVETAGMLDEDFFAYHEDVEWCYRGKKSGFLVTFVPAARVWHPDTRQRNGNSARVTYYMARNRLLFAKKHRLGPGVVARILAGYARTWLSWRLRPRWRSRRLHCDALLHAVWDSAWGRSGRRRRETLPW